ncbi:MAG: hypothetical protein ABIH23_01050 [bacterium]
MIACFDMIAFPQTELNRLVSLPAVAPIRIREQCRIHDATVARDRQVVLSENLIRTLRFRKRKLISKDIHGPGAPVSVCLQPFGVRLKKEIDAAIKTLSGDVTYTLDNRALLAEFCVNAYHSDPIKAAKVD